MFVIGLTGGIGTGKTEVTHVLRELGAVVIESDKVAHLLYRPGTNAYGEITDQFGREVLDETGGRAAGSFTGSFSSLFCRFTSDLRSFKNHIFSKFQTRFQNKWRAKNA